MRHLLCLGWQVQLQKQAARKVYLLSGTGTLAGAKWMSLAADIKREKNNGRY